MSRTSWTRAAALLCAIVLITAACSSDEKSSPATAAPAATEAPAASAAPTATEAPASSAVTASTGATETTAATATTETGSDLTSLGLWDDGPCDASLPPLNLGLVTVFASGVLTLQDQAQALEASAEAFNARGGANMGCIKVQTCDDGADPNKALDCVRELDEGGVSATVNDTTSFGGADVSAAFKAAGIPRFAISPGQDDFNDTNSYPFDAGGTGTSIVMPKPLIDAGLKKIAIIRVDTPSATALKGFYEAVYTEDGAEFVADLPVPAGTTDYSQFILAAQDAGAQGVVMPIGGQEGIQVLRAGQQLGADLKYSSSLGTFPLVDIASLGDYASNVILNAAIPPAGTDDKVVDQLTADLAESGVEALLRPNLKSSPMRSWVGLYALLYVIRESKTTDFSRENLTKLIEESGPIPMLGLMPDWTPKTDHVGAFLRTGQGNYSFWKFDPNAPFGDAKGNFVKDSDATFDKIVCGILSGPC